MPFATQDQATLAAVLQKLDTVATLPEITARIMSVVNSPSSTADDLNEVITHDPALVARLIKIANSSFYGRATKITSVHRAIVMLGFDAIQSLAIGASMETLFRGSRLCNGYTPKDLWTHSLAVGVVAKDLAAQLKMPMAEEVFLAGMTHDLGLLAALPTYPDPLAEICEEAKGEGKDFCEIELHRLGLTHAELGAAVAEKWNFPPFCAHAARFHHSPSSAPLDDRKLVSLIYVADTLCAQEKAGFDLTARNQKLEESILDSAGIGEELLTETRDRLAALVWSAVSIFG